MNPALLVTLEYPPDVGGIAGYLSHLVAHMPTGAVHVLAPMRKGTAVAEGVGVTRRRLLAHFLRPRWLPLAWHAYRECRERGPSAVIVSHVLPVGTVARWLKRRLGIPYVVIAHGMDLAIADAAGGRKRRAAQRVLADAGAVVVNSRFTRDIALRLGADERRVRIVHPSPALARGEASSAEVAAVREKYGLDGAFTALTVCRLVKRKGVHDCIAAVAKLKAAGDVDTKLVVVGSGPERLDLEWTAAEHNVVDRVVFAGSAGADELAALYGASDVFVLTPRTLGPDVEGFGIVYLEANAFGKPVIGSRSGGVSDAIADGVTGLLVDERDAGAIAGALSSLKADPAMRSRMGEAGRKRVLDEFGWDVAARKFSAALDLARR